MFDITALTNGQVKIVNTDTGLITYYANQNYTASSEAGNLRLTNIAVNKRSIVIEYALINTPASTDIEDLCDILNSTPFFFLDSSGGGGGGTCLSVGTIDFSTPRWDSGSTCWVENTDFLQDWSSGTQDFNLSCNDTLFGIGGFAISTSDLAATTNTTGISIINGVGSLSAYDGFVSGSAIQLKVDTSDKSLEIRAGTSGIAGATTQAMRVIENSGPGDTTEDDNSLVCVHINARNSEIAAGAFNSVSIAGRDTVINYANTLATQNFQNNGSYSNPAVFQVVGMAYTTDQDTTFILVPSIGAVVSLAQTTFRAGIVYVIKNISLGSITIDPGAINFIDASAAIITLTSFESITLVNSPNTQNFYII